MINDDASHGSQHDGRSDALLDPAEGLRIIADQTDKVRATQVDGRVLFGVWGVAWLVGYLALYLTAEGHLPGAAAAPDGLLLPATWAYVVFGALIWAAVAITIIYSIRVGSGVRGVSTRTGALYGWSWFIAFAGMGTIIGGLVNLGVSDEVVSLMSNSLACLVVGIMYLAGGTFWQDTRQYVLGIWIIVVAVIALYAGLPDAFLVMAVLGGGGFLLGALGDHLVRTTRTTRTTRAAGARR